jgi:hypothetical protein
MFASKECHASFSLKLLWRADKLFAVYYAFENDETQLIHRKFFANSDLLIALILSFIFYKLPDDPS